MIGIIFKHYLSYFLVVLIILCGAKLSQATVTIKLNEPKQKIVMMGADMERSADAIQSVPNKNDVFQWVFADTKGIDFMRVVFDKNQELNKGVKKLEFYDKQIKSMQEIKAVNPKIRFWATPRTDYDGYGDRNNLPDWIYTGRGYNGGRYEPSKLEVDAYATFLVDYLKLMQSHKVPIYILSIMKEWSQVIDAKTASAVIRAVKRECSRRRVLVPKFIGPASWGVKGGIRDLKAIKKLGDAHLYTAFSVHDYDKPSEKDWVELISVAKSMGKLVFHDETHTGSGGPTHDKEPPVSQPIKAYMNHARFYRAGLSGEVYFENWSRGIDRENRSIYFKRNQTARRMRAYWIMREFSSHTMKSIYVPTEMADESAGLETMAFWKDDQVTIWVMNPKNKDYSSVDFHIKGKRLSTQQPIDRKYWSDIKPEIKGNDNTFKATSTQVFSSPIPAQTLTRLIFKIR